MKLNELTPGKRLKVFVIGESGTGKTVFAHSFPTPIWTADFDGKISSAAAYYAGDKERISGIEYENFLPVPGDAKDLPFVRYHTKLVELEAAAQAGKFPYATIVLDSATLYADQMMKEIMRQNPGLQRPKTNVVQVTCMQDYQIFGMHFKNMLARLLQLPANVVVTGHIQTEKDELTGEIIREPLLPGKQAPKFIPILFEEVYRAHTEIKDGKHTYLAQTQTDYKFKVRTQIKGLPAQVPLAYSELMRYADKGAVQ